MRRTCVRAALLLAALVLAAFGCAAPAQTGTIVVLPGATERLLLAMRMGYGGAGEAKPPAQVRRAVARADLPVGPAAGGRTGDWLLENESVTAVIAHVDGSPRGGRLIDVARAPARSDELASFETSVADLRVRYESLKTGTEDATGTAWVQVTGRSEAAPGVEIVTRYDLAPDLPGLVIHTSIKGPAQTLGRTLAVRDAIAFAPGSMRITRGPHDVAGMGAGSGYVLEPLGDPPFVIDTPGSERASIGVAPELVQIAPQEPYIFSRALLLLERPDPVALAATRALATGQPVGEVELELIALPRAVGQAVTGGRFTFRRAEAPGDALDLPIGVSLRHGDRHLAKIPAGLYDVSFEGHDDWRSVAPARVKVSARGLSPVRVQARRQKAPEPTDAAAPPPEPEPTPIPAAGPP